ncbi:MAG: redox-regulated ATPase YchF [Nanoarchaeota archaeon]|nr:redox-regulated ATPase YchF [Nanoarchaeota archaeon]
MLIGLVGKPSCGKSTFFKAATLANVLIASYPFATIEPNHGVGYVRVECLCRDFNVKCNPQKGYCVDRQRFVPIELMDVAGLVEGASEGKGMGNKFLDDLRQADAFIHIVDISGETDAEGKETNNYNPLNDVRMLENELDLWYSGILKKVWKTFAKKVQVAKEDFAKAVAKQFSGLKVTEDDVKDVLRKSNLKISNSADWTENEVGVFARELRMLTKPMIIAANKIDRPNAKKNYENLKGEFPELMIVPCSADSELALREASKSELIKYIPGDADFEIIGSLSENTLKGTRQKEALENIKKNIISVYGSTGVQNVLNKIVFDLLNYIAVFPAGATKLADSKGNVLPDCFLVPSGSTALDFAYYIHTDLGDNFIKAIDAKTKKAVGKEHKLKHRDGLEIVMR